MEEVLFQEKPSEFDSVMRHLSPVDRSLSLVTKVATLFQNGAGTFVTNFSAHSMSDVPLKVPIILGLLPEKLLY